MLTFSDFINEAKAADTQETVVKIQTQGTGKKVYILKFSDVREPEDVMTEFG